ncbi:LysR family transcriptional regulator [Neptunomonas antarctica]|uniref:Transcriptional regulator, LysR family n=1 Tax=Neptunomonas antarctica TaxID=619304 RepID=A0A1N7J2K0_9GAMM|nr:LysR family transcriptional regulator [Neptunomonas antarctica]SIS43441.1 transcriptional regulator, LysR family [Neptunomonas antarctica]
MDLELLRTFLEVARTRHFGHAAEALHLTQAAVSARIKLLESHLGVQLFDRLKRDIKLTPEGNRLTRHADMLLSEWRKARQDVSAGGANQQISIGGSLRLWDVLLQPWLHTLRTHLPDIALIAESHTPEVLTRRLLDGILDVAFMLEPAHLDVLQIQQIFVLELDLVSSSPNCSVAEAMSAHYLMVDWGLAHSLTHKRLFPDIPEPRTRLGTAKMAISYLQTLGGSAYLPKQAIQHELSTGLLYCVPDAPTIRHPAYAVFPVRGARNTLIQEILPFFNEDNA